MNIFLAGATGVIGRRLVPLLRDAGHAVTGTSRSEEKASALEVLGARGVVVDVYDARALLKAMSAAHPDVVIHQLTDLPQSLDAGRPANFEGNARLRIEGTRNLMAAASVVGARRVVAQSIAFVYADGPGARVETDPLDRNPARRRRSARWNRSKSRCSACRGSTASCCATAGFMAPAPGTRRRPGPARFTSMRPRMRRCSR